MSKLDVSLYYFSLKHIEAGKVKGVCMHEHVFVGVYLFPHNHLGMAAFGYTWADHQKSK